RFCAPDPPLYWFLVLYNATPEIDLKPFHRWALLHRSVITFASQFLCDVIYVPRSQKFCRQERWPFPAGNHSIRQTASRKREVESFMAQVQNPTAGPKCVNDWGITQVRCAAPIMVPQSLSHSVKRFEY